MTFQKSLSLKAKSPENVTEWKKVGDFCKTG